MWTDIFYVCVCVGRTRSMRRNALISKFTTQSRNKKKRPNEWKLIHFRDESFVFLFIVPHKKRRPDKNNTRASEFTVRSNKRFLPTPSLSFFFFTNHPHNLNWQHIRRSITFYEYLTNSSKQIDLTDNISSGLIRLCLLNSEMKRKTLGVN